MTDLHSINHEQRLYVLDEGKGRVSCLGFDVCEERITRYAAALGLSHPATTRGTAEAYETYRRLIGLAFERFNAGGPPLDCDLTPQLRGLEGRRVEVVDKYGEKRRFNVGKSTGWIPIHLEVHNRRSTGGGGVTGAPFQSVTVIR